MLFAQVPALSALAAAGGTAEAAGFLLVAQAWANAGAEGLLGGRPRRAAALAGLLALGAAAAIALGLSAADSGARPWLGVALGLACAATALLWGGARPALAPLSLAGGLLAGVELAVAAGLAGGVTATTVLGVVAAAGLAAAYLGWRASPRPASLALVTVAASAAASVVVGLVDGGHAGGVAVAVGALAVAFTVVSTAGRRLEAYAPAAVAWWCTLAAGLAWLETPEGRAGVVLAGGTAGLVAAAWRARRTDVELATSLAAAVAGFISISLATASPGTWLPPWPWSAWPRWSPAFVRAAKAWPWWGYRCSRAPGGCFSPMPTSPWWRPTACRWPPCAWSSAWCATGATPAPGVG